MKPDAERQRDTRRRMRAAGFVLRQMWVHPADWIAVKSYIERKRKRRNVPQHVCGLDGYDGMIDPPCPACRPTDEATAVQSDREKVSHE